MDLMFRVMARGRQAGKTTEALEWVKKGVRTNRYPGWSRVLLTPNMDTMRHLRHMAWKDIEDFDHRIYTYEDWRRGHIQDRSVEVRIDDLDILLHHVLGYVPGRLTGFTLSADPWETPEEDPAPVPRAGPFWKGDHP